MFSTSQNYFPHPVCCGTGIVITYSEYKCSLLYVASLERTPFSMWLQVNVKWATERIEPCWPLAGSGGFIHNALQMSGGKQTRNAEILHATSISLVCFGVYHISIISTVLHLSFFFTNFLRSVKDLIKILRYVSWLWFGLPKEGERNFLLSWFLLSGYTFVSPWHAFPNQ